MGNVAVLVGNATYSNLPDLECCKVDLDAMASLVESTGKFHHIERLFNADADQIKSGLRSVLGGTESFDEIFFYFSGHGLQVDGDFFFCGTSFDARRPNETGLSNSDLHDQFRAVNPTLVVKIVDACSSGALLVKGNDGFLPSSKGGLNNLIQIASCLDSQNSLAGDPLSPFTESFCEAALRMDEGPVYYSDIISTLRDDFLENQSQIPHFVSQGTGREVLTDDATKLAAFRKTFDEIWLPVGSGEEGEGEISDQLPTRELTLLERLRETEAELAKPDDVEVLVSTLFDSIKDRLGTEDFSDYFDISFLEHDDFFEETTREFIIRTLVKEKRHDDFVTARVDQIKKQRPDPYGLRWTAMHLFASDEEVRESWHLKLNLSMRRVQLRVTLTPKFSSLKQIILVVSAAPSLDLCYVFELATEHQLIDFGKYASTGTEIVRRWYKKEYRESTDFMAGKIVDALKNRVQINLDETTKRLTSE